MPIKNVYKISEDGSDLFMEFDEDECTVEITPKGGKSFSLTIGQALELAHLIIKRWEETG
jgi:hypothetical protein